MARNLILGFVMTIVSFMDMLGMIATIWWVTYAIAIENRRLHLYFLKKKLIRLQRKMKWVVRGNSNFYTNWGHIMFYLILNENHYM